MQMPIGTFCNKLSPRHPTKFSDTEIIKLQAVLLEMQNDLDVVTDMDFNDALKGVLNG